MDEEIRKAMESGNFRCLKYILEKKDLVDIDTVRHMLATYRDIYEGKNIKNEELLEKIFDELGFDQLTRSLIRTFFSNDSTVNFYCSKIISVFQVPTSVCETCKIRLLSFFNEPKKVIDHIIRSISDVTFDGETVTIYVTSERAGNVTVPVKIKHDDLIKFYLQSTPSPENKGWEKRGKPVNFALKLFNIITGMLPLVPMVNLDTKPLWEDINARMRMDVEDPSEIVKIIYSVIKDMIPEDLNLIDPNVHILTPSLLDYYHRAGEIVSLRAVLREKNSVLRVWIHSKYLQHLLATTLGREIELKQLRAVIIDMGGVTSSKLGIGPKEFRDKRGYDIPAFSLGDLEEKLKEYYKLAEELGQTKRKLLTGGDSDA